MNTSERLTNHNGNEYIAVLFAMVAYDTFILPHCLQSVYLSYCCFVVV